MKHLLIIGARGFGREIYRSFIHTKPYIEKEIDVKGFLDDKADALDGLKGEWPPIIGAVETYEIQRDRLHHGGIFMQLRHGICAA